jgi:ribosomal protein S18 acetylase RimI-like enzyme
MIEPGQPMRAEQGSSKDGPCVLRPATPTDRDAVVALVFETLRSFGIEPEPEGIDSDVVEFGMHADPRLFEIVADVGGAPVGSIALRDRGDGSGHVSKFFVNSALRGQGIGRRLLDAAVSEARRRRLHRLDLETRGQFDAAVHLYEVTGWERGPDPRNACDRTYVLQLRDAP